ncbi:MAG: hypothetical protein WBQ21_11695 [Solirubrobacteraceae bacterium]
MSRPDVTLPPDPWWENFHSDHAALARSAARWPVSEAVPEGIATVLRVSRDLFVQSYFVHEFLLTAVTWGLLALEGSLRVCLKASDRDSLDALIRRARGRGLLTADEANSLDAGRQLRNQIIHGALLPTSLTPGMAEQMLLATHEATSDLHARTEADTQS